MENQAEGQNEPVNENQTTAPAAQEEKVVEQPPAQEKEVAQPTEARSEQKVETKVEDTPEPVIPVPAEGMEQPKIEDTAPIESEPGPVAPKEEPTPEPGQIETSPIEKGEIAPAAETQPAPIQEPVVAPAAPVIPETPAQVPASEQKVAETVQPSVVKEEQKISEPVQPMSQAPYGQVS